MSQSIYLVQPGDTVYKISSRFNITYKTLQEINPHLNNINSIFPGMQINISREKKPDNLPTPTIINPTNPCPWIDIAKSQMGVKEIAGSDHNPKIIEYHTFTTLKATQDEIPWCSAFVNYCMIMSGYIGTESAAAKSWLKWGKDIGISKPNSVVILDRGNVPWQGHVGFYLEDNGSKRIYVLGGNQGDMVKISSYPKSLVVGYRWPTDKEQK